MRNPDEEEMRRARTARLIAIVLGLTMVLWVGLQWLGGNFGWPARWVFLFDLAALAAFLWAMIVAVGLWRGHKDG